jgi:hypothetical protein
MCQSSTDHDIEKQALCYYRFFVYREYREIRFLGHPRIGRYDKFAERYPVLANLGRTAFARVWYDISSETDPARIMQPFQELTGLTLQHIEEAFRKGEWHPAKAEVKVFGGPKHADIAMHAMRLGEAIQAGRWSDAVPNELAVLKNISHNCPRPSRQEYKSLLEDLATLELPMPDCCLLTGAE